MAWTVMNYTEKICVIIFRRLNYPKKNQKKRTMTGRKRKKRIMIGKYLHVNIVLDLVLIKKKTFIM